MILNNFFYQANTRKPGAFEQKNNQIDSNVRYLCIQLLDLKSNLWFFLFLSDWLFKILVGFWKFQPKRKFLGGHKILNQKNFSLLNFCLDNEDKRLFYDNILSIVRFIHCNTVTV